MNKLYQFVMATLCVLSIPSCDYLTDIDMPVDKLTKETLFSDSTTLNAAVEGLYSKNLLSNSIYYGMLPLYVSAMADESYHNVTAYDILNQNSYSPTTNYTPSLWNSPYTSIYQSNALIENLEATSSVSESIRKQYIAQAKYFRAYSHFVLVNFFGDVPLVLITDYKESSLLPREKTSVVYEQIIRDLTEAETEIDGCGNGNNKVTKAAVSALLARVYLYVGNWAEAEAKASEVIATSGCRLEDDLDNVFLRSGREAIFKITSNYATYTGRTYWGTVAANRSYNFIREQLYDAFEAGDLRKEKWTIQRDNASGIYYQCYKYKRDNIPSNAADAEDYILLRLAEQFLILAEAQAQQSKIAQAAENLNKLRARAGLPDLSPALTREQMLLAVEQERRIELFMEEAHRWWDLKRTGRIDEVLSLISDKNWKPYKALLPIPDVELSNNPNLTENPGYGDFH